MNGRPSIERHLFGRESTPAASVVIPHFPTFKSGKLDRLLDELSRQSLQPLEVIVVRGVRPSGRARNLGALRAKSNWLILMDDYTRFAHTHVLRNLVATLRKDPEIGIAGVAKRLPPGAGSFMRMVAQQMPRTLSPVVHYPIDTDMATTTCMGMALDLYIALGGQHVGLIRGTDPDLRDRVRAAGKRVVIAPGTLCYKPQADNLQQFIRTEWKRGLAMVWAYWTARDRMLFTPEPGEVLPETAASTPGYFSQILRYLAGVPWALLRGKPLLALAKLIWMAAFLPGPVPAWITRIGQGNGVWPFPANPYPLSLPAEPKS